jgi:hypothetical protein
MAGRILYLGNYLPEQDQMGELIPDPEEIETTSEANDADADVSSKMLLTSSPPLIARMERRVSLNYSLSVFISPHLIP